MIGKAKILVVDDEPDSLNLTKMILEGERYQLVFGSNGEEALQKADSEAPDLILLDVVMLGKSGFEVCKILKAQSKTKLTPVVLFSALGRDVDRKMGRDVGAQGYLTKPFTKESLVAEVKKQLERARPEKFSKALDLDHIQLRGRKLLFEFDPATPYERAIRDFALEAQANGESVVILAPKTSSVQQILQGEETLEFVPLSPKTILSPVLESHAGKPLAIVFDSLSDLIFSMGFNSAYGFTRNALEMLAGPRITAIFLLNPKAHPPNEVYGIRSLFSEQAAYAWEGLTKIKLT